MAADILKRLTVIVALSCFFVLAVHAQSGGRFTDPRDKKTYRTVRIGNRTWMAENLNYQTADSWCYADRHSNCTKYGRLYTWDAAAAACPAGWRLATPADWNDLLSAVGGRSAANRKLRSKTDWIDWDGNPIHDGSDEFGFSALPGGSRSANGVFGNINSSGRWWSAGESGNGLARSLGIDWSREYTHDHDGVKQSGFSVRCSKD